MNRTDRPSGLAKRLLKWALPADRYDDITGDLDEVFGRRNRLRGSFEARCWYWRESSALAFRFSIEGIRERLRRTRRSARQGVHDSRWRPGLGVSLLDLKLGVRMLARNPGLTLVSTVALAIAIAIIAGFHAATQFMVRPALPLPDGERMVGIWQHDLGTRDSGVHTLGDMLAWTELETLDDVGAFRLRERAVGANGETRLIRAAELTPSAFDLVGIPPELGRPLIAADSAPGAPAVAVIGHELWQSAFDADPAVVGEPVRVGGDAYTIVGVMPEGYAFPRRESLWLPMPVSPADAAPDASPTIDFAVARMAPDATLDQVDAELQFAGARLATDYPETHGRLRPRVSRYAESFLQSSEPELAILMQAARIAIGIVLLVVAVNVGALIYARNAARLGEIAVRMALGASRRRIVLQMFIEALVLSTLAAILGVGILWWPFHQFRSVFDSAIAQGDGLPFWFEVGLGSDTILVIVAMTLLSAVLTGVLPALKLTSSQVQSRLQRSQQSNASLRFGRTSTLVVVSQVALSVALLTVGGAQLRTFIADWWGRDDTSVSREEFLTARLRWDPASDAAEVNEARGILARAETRRELGRRIARGSDVQGATFQSFQRVGFFTSDSAGDAGLSGLRYSYVTAIDPNFFDVQGSPIRVGRALGAGDIVETAAPVAVVNEAFVRAVLGTGDPVGQRVRRIDPRSGRPTGDWVRIVGVVRDTPALEISQRGPEWIARPTVFVPLRDAMSSVVMLVRANVPAAPLAGRLQALAAEVDPTLILHRVQSVEESDRFGLTMAGLYGVAVGFFVFAALLLSTTGVYAMMSFTATQRTREIGIRTALGAPAGRVVGAVFSRAMYQLGTGTVLGLALGYLAADGPLALSGGLFAEGPEVVVGVAASILVMGLIACDKPMRRALRVEPTEALRTES